MKIYDNYSYYYGNSYEETILMGIVMIITIVLLVWALFSLGSYILKGIGMYTIAKRLGVDYAWLAFIPFARTYLHGELAGSIMLKKKKIQNPGVWLLALPFLYSAIYSIFYAIIWFMGFGTMMKVASYDYMPYNLNVSTGNIMGIIIVFLILMVIVLGYTAFYKALQVLVNHQILERFTSKNMSIVHSILCTIIPLYESICFFVMRNRTFNPGMEPPASTPFMQSPPPESYYGNYSQNGYSGGFTQGGYENYNGTPGTAGTNNYRNSGGQPTQTDSNNYGNSGGQPTQTDSNNYGNSGGQPVQSETNYNSYNHWDGSLMQEGTNSYGGGSSAQSDISSQSPAAQSHDADSPSTSTDYHSSGILQTEDASAKGLTVSIDSTVFNENLQTGAAALPAENEDAIRFTDSSEDKRSDTN